MTGRLLAAGVRVLVVGPVSWNHTVFLEELPPAVPHTEPARSHHVGIGGTSAGKALTLRALGVDVTVRTVVGRDREAEKALAELTARGVHLIVEMASGGATERHINLVDRHGRRISLYLSTPELVDGDVRHGDQTAGAVASAAAVVVDLSDASRPLLAQARRAGRPVWCDLHDYDGESAWHEDFVKASDYVFMNDDKLPDPVPLMRRLAAGGARMVVVTRGARGALALPADGDVLEVPALPVQVLDSTGAGDAFFAGYLTGHLGGGSVSRCLALATETAARCVGSVGLAF